MSKSGNIQSLIGTTRKIGFFDFKITGISQMEDKSILHCELILKHKKKRGKKHAR